MKTRIVIFLTLVAGLISIQGCYAEGDFFPGPKEPVRRQTSLDKEPGRGDSVLDEPWEIPSETWVVRHGDSR